MDPLLGIPLRVGLGYWLSQPGVPGFASVRTRAPSAIPARAARSASRIRRARVGFGYVTNRMGSSLVVDERPQALIDALYAS